MVIFALPGPKTLKGIKYFDLLFRHNHQSNHQSIKKSVIYTLKFAGKNAKSERKSNKYSSDKLRDAPAHGAPKAANIY